MFLTLLACTPSPDRTELLPAHVAVTIALEDASVGTLLADLRGPDEPPRIRVAEDDLVFRDGVPVHAETIAYDAHAEGPGQGFTVRQDEDAVVLILPKRDEPTVLVEGVAEILEVSLLPQLDEAVTDELFQSVHAIYAAPKAARIDGDLQEWDGKAIAVDDRSVVEAGSASWEGPRDASVAVAARVHHRRVSFGLRIRDEDLVLGEDKVVVLFDGQLVEIPVASAGSCAVPEGWECAFVEAVEFGTGLEFSLPDTREPPGEHVLPAVVRYFDVDEGEDGTVLSTAPSLEAVARYGVQRPGPRGSPANSKMPTKTMP
ncbi:MAG TPA: hypothetical protein QGF58_20690 [Myxococcota bacterium]|nr:hypothetical protein [Myxococcota bacterium]